MDFILVYASLKSLFDSIEINFDMSTILFLLWNMEYDGYDVRSPVSFYNFFDIFMTCYRLVSNF